MGEPTGFKQWSRRVADKRAPGERIGDFEEFVEERPAELRRTQGGRCMSCGVPFCEQGCPLGNQIPDFNDAIYRDDWRGAYRRLSATNNFPEFTGRLCPAPCETACVLEIGGAPITICQNEREIAERAFAEGWVEARPPQTRSGKQVAIVGSGPAALAAAAQLNRAGHQVTVHEADDRIGGLLRYGIPDFKLDKRVIDRRLDVLRAEGIEFRTGVCVGRALRWDALVAQHDATVIAIGALRARELDLPGRELAGVHLALDYLTQQNRVVAGEGAPTERIDAAGKHVIILGGGDTGADCLGTAHRQGAASVVQVELLPQPPLTRGPDNPWPQWPLVLRSGSSHEEGGEREFALMTKRLAGEAGRLTALHAVRIDLERDAAGRVSFAERPASELELPCDLLLLATGFVGPEADLLVAQLGVKRDARGNVAAGADFATNVEGVFVAGDARRGASLVVWALAEGREAARHVDAYLRGEPSVLPTRGTDAPF